VVGGVAWIELAWDICHLWAPVKMVMNFQA